MAKQRLFVVCSTTGQYEDRQEYLLCAFRSKAEAEKCVADARAWLMEHPAPTDDRTVEEGWDYEKLDRRRKKWRARNPFDRTVESDSIYYWTPVPLAATHPLPPSRKKKE